MIDPSLVLVEHDMNGHTDDDLLHTNVTHDSIPADCRLQSARVATNHFLLDFGSGYGLAVLRDVGDVDENEEEGRGSSVWRNRTQLTIVALVLTLLAIAAIVSCSAPQWCGRVRVCGSSTRQSIREPSSGSGREVVHASTVCGRGRLSSRHFAYSEGRHSSVRVQCDLQTRYQSVPG